MKIGIDLLPWQCPTEANLTARSLADRLIEALREHDDHVVAYRRRDLGLPEGMPADLRTIPRVPDHTDAFLMDREVARNVDHLDAFLVVDPFVAWKDTLVPDVPTAADRPVMAAMLPDEFATASVHAIRALSRYDLLLVASETSRRHAISRLDVDADRVVVVGDSPSRIRQAIVERIGEPQTPPKSRNVARGNVPLAVVANGPIGFAVDLVRDLKASYRVDLFHEPGDPPREFFDDPTVVPVDRRLMGMMATARDYRAVVAVGGDRFDPAAIPISRPIVVVLPVFRDDSPQLDAALRDRAEFVVVLTQRALYQAAAWAPDLIDRLEYAPEGPPGSRFVAIVERAARRRKFLTQFAASRGVA